MSRTTPGSGVGHHVNGVEPVFVFFDQLHEVGRNGVVRVGPNIDDLVVALLLSQESGTGLLLDLDHFGFGRSDDGVFALRDFDVVDGNGDSGTCRVLKTHILEVVKELRRQRNAAVLVNVIHQVDDVFFLHHSVPVTLRHIIRDDRTENHSPGCRRHDVPVDHGTNTGIEIEGLLLIGNENLISTGKQFVLPFDFCFFQ